MLLWDHSLRVRDLMILREQPEPVLIYCWTDSLNSDMTMICTTGSQVGVILPPQGRFVNVWMYFWLSKLGVLSGSPQKRMNSLLVSVVPGLQEVR